MTAAKMRKGKPMIEYNFDNMTGKEKGAYLYAGSHAHEFMAEIGKHDLATLTADEWLIFCQCMCKNYLNKIKENV